MARGFSWRAFFGELWRSILRDQPFDLAAQLAYYAVLALFPFAMFVLTVIGYLPLHGLDAQMTRMVYQVMPTQAAQLVDQTVHEVVGRQRGGLLIASIVFATWSASGGASGLTTALNRAYRVEETRSPLRLKARAILFTIGAALLVIVATTAMLIGPEMVRRVWDWFGLGGAFDELWALLRWPVGVLALLLTFASVYWFLPNVKQRFRLLSPGAVVGLGLWVLASLAFRQYVSHFGSYAKTYGTLATAMVLLVWLYLSGLAVIFGGEINAVLARMRAPAEAKAPSPSSTRRSAQAI